MVVEALVTIQIEIVDEEDEVLRADLSVAVFSFKLTELFGTDVARTIPVNPSECGVGFKVTDGSQDLAHLFDCKFLVGDEEE